MHRLLQRQIQRHLGDSSSLSGNCQEFLDAVSEAYEQADRDRRMIEHSLELMSQELTERNRALARQLEEKQAVEQLLRKEKEEQTTLIKRLNEAQNQLLQSEKVASIGQLAAGVAHEINNPIGYVNSNLGTLEKYVELLLAVLDAYEKMEDLMAADPERFGKIRRIKEQAQLEFLKQDLRALMSESGEGIQRVRRIVQDLKDFSHVDEVEWGFADLSKGLDSTLNVVWNEIKYKAKVVKEYGDIPQIECLASQLNQVFLNLLVNAAHAIEDHGVITLRTGAGDGEVWVEVADTGKGIPAQNLTRIFDPFFTTKPVGQGTGLGLSLSYGIIQKHHGKIEVQSTPGCGSTFRVRLPVCQPKPADG